MKKLIMVLCALFCSVAHAGPIANIEYIHALIKQRHGIDIEYSPELKSEKLAANMKYLLTLVDIANTRINRAKFTHYGENETYATLNAADTDTVITAVDNLIVPIKYHFHFTPAVETNEYMFKIGSGGTYYIDWGDGTVERITTGTAWREISHTYDTPAKNYTIHLGGHSTGYDGARVVLFPQLLSEISGCLGCVFPGNAATIPRFGNAFQNQTELTSLPENLFDGLYNDRMSQNMFLSTFAGCTGLKFIPDKLFSSLRVPGSGAFSSTFNGCAGLTEIPGNLFATIQGAPTADLFNYTFANTGITSIPENLFAGIYGTPATEMFKRTFAGCTELTEIPENLFAGIDDTAPAAYDMFWATFENDKAITGYSPKINGRYLYEIWPDAENVAYRGCSNLADYADMPATWK